LEADRQGYRFLLGNLLFDVLAPWLAERFPSHVNVEEWQGEKGGRFTGRGGVTDQSGEDRLPAR